MEQKVFCIGLGKTGTSSLAKALELMGFHVGRRLKIFQKHFPNLDLIEAINSKNYEPIVEITQKFDAFVDNPWPLLYRELYNKYPNAKFILTTRNEDDWLSSAQNYFGKSRSKFRGLIYGEERIVNNQEQYLDVYRQHNQEVVSFFRGKKDSLLVLPLESKNKWVLLKGFLDRETPQIPYPHSNSFKKHSNSSKWRKLFKPLYLEVMFTLCFARLLILFFPFKRLAEIMSKPVKPLQSTKIEERHYTEAVEVSQVVRSLSKKVPFRAYCFEQALCTQMLLRRRGISSQIFFGLNKPEDHLLAHAWCMYKGVTLTGEKGMERFTTVKSFGNT